MSIGRLESVPLREVWKHEEADFSAWLSENIDILSEAIGIELNETRREQKVGSYRVDLIAEDGRGDLVVIENQLESTNHDHLGKLLTYFTGLDAKTAIWITSQPRAEHTKAVQWLNESTPDDVSFYLVKLDAVKIGTSVPAPSLTVVVGPSSESKEFGRQKREIVKEDATRFRFWEGLLAYAQKKGLTTHVHVTANERNALDASVGCVSGLHYRYIVREGIKPGVDLYLKTPDKESDKRRLYDPIVAKREAIEERFGEPLIWMRINGKKHSCIRYLISEILTNDESQWPNIYTKLVDAMGRLSTALDAHIKNLRD